MDMKTLKMLLILSAILVTGCASINKPQTADCHMHAECKVCEANADLACVDVAVDDKTPKYDYNGKTYYFCSETCRDDFAKKPQKYAAK